MTFAISAEERNALAHYGIVRKSGRYPWGSGDTPHQRAETFQSIVAAHRKAGMKDPEIAKMYGMNTSDFRDNVTLAARAKVAAEISQAQRLRDKGNSNVAIGKKMGIPESTVRQRLKEGAAEKNAIIENTAALLREQVAKKKYIDVGKGVEIHLNLSHEKLKTARKILMDEGYKMWYVPVEQLGTGKKTTVKVLASPDSTYAEVARNQDQIQQIRMRSRDGGRSFENDSIMPPLSISSKRVGVRYAEQGGKDADGVIYVRPGVKDVELGRSKYAQVRIAVDGTHYLKGMAMYKDDLPPGVDLLFNTNKSNTGNKLDAMKKLKDDPDDPFGANIDRQNYVIGPDGKRRVSSVMNIVNEEGKWDEWSKNLSSQMLSKQRTPLAKEQLKLTLESKQAEFDRIMGLTNPTVKRHLLEKFADSADSSAVHLKAAHLPRQATKVILPVNSMKDTEIYAPTFDNGERVVLVRFPHGGIFEIPELTVNNNHREAKKLLGNAPDAVGIHSRVAERLSGADFDGDTVLVIPNPQGKIKTKPALEGLKGFDPQAAYPGYEGMPAMSAKTKGLEMGKISNLITDMTIGGATDNELERAVKHSMVVIDAEKHKLNYKQSAIDNGIKALKEKYQGGATAGASTIISRATSTTKVPDRKLRSVKDGGPIDKDGKLVYVKTGVKYFNDEDKTVAVEKLALTDDARTLISDYDMPIERVYANHSNSLKSLANRARKETLGIADLDRSPSAAKQFSPEVESLKNKLELAQENAPRERQAQILANALYKQKADNQPDLDKAQIKKLKAKSLENARLVVGSKKDLIDITPREWEAIQAGAISKSMLEDILDNTDVDKIKELATPRDKPLMTPAMKAKAAVLLNNDRYTLAEVARHLGVSVSTLTSSL